ncbi:MAG: hypothetical protein EOP52_06135 [Sphingobacteriales bacterium]|nr:MAG: hypothetical protein EOP52_06135 [Sphingobacteriales bacterium]
MNNSYYDLIAKVLSQEATPEETATLTAACAADTDLAKEFEDAQLLWTLTERAMPAFNVDTDAAWQSVLSRIETTEQMSPVANPSGTRRIAFPVWARWAAAAAILGVGLTFGLRQFNSSEMILADRTGQQVQLPDGSTVTLQKGARIRYASRFTSGAERTVSLEGEAFFDVTKDPQHPFVVRANALQVTVLGTSFRVDGSHTEVSVRSGRVAVAKDQIPEVILTAGEEAVVAKDGQLQKQPADSNDFFLKTSQIGFTNKAFGDIIGDISRILGVSVQLDDSIDSAGRAQTVTYTSTAGTVDSILTDLCRITGYQWRKTGETYQIYRAR